MLQFDWLLNHFPGAFSPKKSVRARVFQCLVSDSTKTIRLLAHLIEISSS